jgi:hypothetical protein
MVVAQVEQFQAAKQVVDEAGDKATSVLLDDWTDRAERRGLVPGGSQLDLSRQV